MKLSLHLRQPGMMIILMLVSLATPDGKLFAQPKIEKVLVIPEKDLIPEGIAYDQKTKTLFISSIQKNKILSVDAQGIYKDFVRSNQDEIKQVLGMKVVNGKLWACNNTPDYDTTFREANIHVYDIETRRLEKRITLNDGKRHLFNDLVITSSGDCYVTDSDGAGLYVIKKGSEIPEAFLPPGSIPYPNGITMTADEKKLIVSTGGGQGIISVDLETKAVVPIAHEKYLLIGADGLYRYNNKLIAVQNVTYPEAVIELTLNESATAVTSIKTLCVNQREFDTPTTGVIVGDDFYFIANAQLVQINGQHGKFKNAAALKEPVIMKIKLN